MKCPICNVDLLMADKHGIEIDYCPTCRGIWLDRGELEKLVERVVALERSSSAQPAHVSGERYDHYSHGHHGHDKHHYGRRESIWHRMFDFG